MENEEFITVLAGTNSVPIAISRRRWDTKPSDFSSLDACLVSNNTNGPNLISREISLNSLASMAATPGGDQQTDHLTDVLRDDGAKPGCMANLDMNSDTNPMPSETARFVTSVWNQLTTTHKLGAM